MFSVNHNDSSKQFMKKILMFIDTIFINTSTASSEDSNKILTTGLLNVRDAILSEIVRDNQVLQLQKMIQKEEAKKKEKEKDLNQEEKLEKDQLK